MSSSNLLAGDTDSRVISETVRSSNRDSESTASNTRVYVSVAQVPVNFMEVASKTLAFCSSIFLLLLP